MKLSILTPSYNRANLLPKLYESLLKNQQNSPNFDYEWLIMDDGSQDQTREIVEEWVKEGKVRVRYYWQENQGKAKAINHLMEYATGNYVMDCDSDDFFVPDAFEQIKKIVPELEKDETIYGGIFLKRDEQGKISGNLFPQNGYRSTMYDLYFKEDIQGEKMIVFKTKIRRQYHHEVEEREKFITEARMYHKMDEKYRVFCWNIPLIQGDYLQDGYTSNITNIFLKNPKGYYEYFKEALNHPNEKGILFSKKLYLIKHYLLFAYLSHQKNVIKNVKGAGNKLWVTGLYIPAYLSSARYQKRYSEIKLTK